MSLLRNRREGIKPAIAFKKKSDTGGLIINKLNKDRLANKQPTSRKRLMLSTVLPCSA